MSDEAKTEIIILDKVIVPAILFGGKSEDGKDPLEDLLVKFEGHARDQLADIETYNITTPKGRKEIASLAYQAGRTKNTLDTMGKDLNEERRKAITAVNEDRNRATARLQALQDEIRKPLTDFEDAEKERVAAHEEAHALLTTLGKFDFTPTVSDISDRISDADNLYKDRDWEEFASIAKGEYVEVSESLDKRLVDQKKHDDDQAELERLRKETEERETKEREDRIAHEAAEQATKDAEEAAKVEAKAAADKAQAEKDEIERKAKEEREAAEQRAEQAEADKKEAEAATKRAAEEERQRIDAERQAEEEAAKKREDNKRHNAKINNAALSALAKIGLSEADSKKVVQAIAKREIPNVTISY